MSDFKTFHVLTWRNRFKYMKTWTLELSLSFLWFNLHCSFDKNYCQCQCQVKFLSIILRQMPAFLPSCWLAYAEAVPLKEFFSSVVDCSCRPVAGLAYGYYLLHLASASHWCLEVSTNRRNLYYSSPSTWIVYTICKAVLWEKLKEALCFEPVKYRVPSI